MNKLIKFILLSQVLIFVGCMSREVRVGNKSMEAVKVGEHKNELANGLVADNTVWVVQAGVKGEAGLYSSDKVLPIKALKLDVNIIEFLASVSVSVSYAALRPNKDLSFKYPAFHGMLVKDFLVQVGARKFRAVISERESAEELFNLAKMQGFNAILVSQKSFGDMIVSLSVKEKSDLQVEFNYSQLTAVANSKRILALPEFPGLSDGAFNLSIKGDFSSDLISFEGLGKKVKGHKFVENIDDKKVLKGGLVLKYKTKGFHTLSSDKKNGVMWDSVSKSYKASALKKGDEAIFCELGTLEHVFGYLHLQKMLEEGKPYKEIQSYAVQSRLLTPITRLLLVDSIR